MTYHCRVVRATPRSGGCSEYGLLFVEMDEGIRSGLARNLQIIREETEKKLGVDSLEAGGPMPQ